ncbi:MAG: nucleotidyltransferase [Anaerolineaceae bacterium]
MAYDWEDTFRLWSQPPSSTEDAKCGNAERMIRDAIDKDPVLSQHNIKVFATGSYKNNTNVRNDSDVDICVECFDTFFYDLPSDGSLTASEVGIIAASYPYDQYKNGVQNALINKFGKNAVARGNKTFDIHENTYRVDADVTPAFEHRRYYRGSNSSINYSSGIELRPDNGGRVKNWPDQHYSNGVQKNNQTLHRYKYNVRILKRLRNELEKAKILTTNLIPSFLIECLVWNVPNENFGHTYLQSDVRAVLAFLFNETRSDEQCSEWGEVSELKYLFRSSQPWTREQAHMFCDKSWDYLGFE